MKRTNKRNQEPVAVPTNLTMFQRVALEGEVCSCYEMALHQADKAYFSYVLLICTPPEFRPFFEEEMLNYVDLEVIETANKYINRDVFPVTLLVNKVISDIKTYLGEEECLKDRAPKYPKQMLKSKFTNYIRMTGELVPSIAKEIIDRIINDEDLEFLSDVSFSCLMELSGKKDLVSDSFRIIKIFQPTIAEISLASFTKETEAIEEDKEISDQALMDIVNSVLDKPNKSQKTYIVQKINKATKEVAMTKEFSSQAKAVQFIKKIGKDYPELTKSYDFIIVSGVEEDWM